MRTLPGGSRGVVTISVFDSWNTAFAFCSRVRESQSKGNVLLYRIKQLSWACLRNYFPKWRSYRHLLLFLGQEVPQRGKVPLLFEAVVKGLWYKEEGGMWTTFWYLLEIVGVREYFNGCRQGLYPWDVNKGIPIVSFQGKQKSESGSLVNCEY